MTIKSRLAAVLAMATLATITAVGLAAPASAQTASAPYCGIYWGSLAKSSAAPQSEGTLTKVRVGQHECYDRMVIDIAGPVGGYSVQYDPNHTLFSSPDPSFYPRGGAYLVISIQNAVIPRTTGGYGTTATASADEAADVTGFRTFRQIKEIIYGNGYGPNYLIGDVLALGVRARLPFRVFTLDGPGNNTRFVVDVAHRW